jgi:hypothetical protein
MSEVSRVLLGLSVIKSVVAPDNFDDFTVIAQIATGKYKEDILLAFENTMCGSPTLFDGATLTAEQAYERVVQIAKGNIREVFRLADLEDRQEQEQKVAAVKAELATRNQVSEFGSVAEIAAKYNISKSEVRRLKAAGELQAFIEQRTQA